MKAVLARIDRDLTESSKLRAETNKFLAEQTNLISEASKLDRDRGLAPWLAIIGLVGGLRAIANFLTRFAH